MRNSLQYTVLFSILVPHQIVWVMQLHRIDSDLLLVTVK